MFFLFLDSTFLNQNLAKNHNFICIFMEIHSPIFNFFRQASILLANKDSFEKIMQTLKLFSKEKIQKLNQLKILISI